MGNQENESASVLRVVAIMMLAVVAVLMIAGCGSNVAPSASSQPQESSTVESSVEANATLSSESAETTLVNPESEEAAAKEDAENSSVSRGAEGTVFEESADGVVTLAGTDVTGFIVLPSEWKRSNWQAEKNGILFYRPFNSDEQVDGVVIGITYVPVSFEKYPAEILDGATPNYETIEVAGRPAYYFISRGTIPTYAVKTDNGNCALFFIETSDKNGRVEFAKIMDTYVSAKEDVPGASMQLAGSTNLGFVQLPIDYRLTYDSLGGDIHRAIYQVPDKDTPDAMFIMKFGNETLDDFKANKRSESAGEEVRREEKKINDFDGYVITERNKDDEGYVGYYGIDIAGVECIEFTVAAPGDDPEALDAYLETYQGPICPIDIS